MKLVSYNYSSGEDWHGECDFAWIDLTPELTKDLIHKLESVQKLHSQDERLTAVDYKNDAPIFFAKLDAENEGEFEDQVMNADSFIECHFAMTWNNPHTSMDYVRLVVTPDCVWWEGTPRHDRVVIETKSLSLIWLREILAKGGSHEPSKAITDAA